MVLGVIELEEKEKKDKLELWSILTNSWGKSFLLFCFLLRENRKTVVWNEIPLLGQYGIAYENFSSSGVQKTLWSSF